MSIARYGATYGGSYRRGPQHYVPAAVGHSGRCIVLQNFLQTIYFCKIEIEKIKKFLITPPESRSPVTNLSVHPQVISIFLFFYIFFTISKKIYSRLKILQK
jgi:hypothetical protein